MRCLAAADRAIVERGLNRAKGLRAAAHAIHHHPTATTHLEIALTP